MTGILGADISNVLLHIFGIASFLLVVIFGGWGLQLIYAGKPGHLVTRILGALGFLFSGAAFASLFEWIFFFPDGLTTWKMFVPGYSLGGRVGDFIGSKLLTVFSLTPDLKIPPQAAVILILLVLILGAVMGMLAFKMPADYWLAVGKPFSQIYHYFSPEKTGKRRSRRQAFGDSPFSDIQPPNEPAFAPSKAQNNAKTSTENPWFSPKPSNVNISPFEPLVPDRSPLAAVEESPILSEKHSENQETSQVHETTAAPTILEENHVDLSVAQSQSETREVQAQPPFKPEEELQAEMPAATSLGKFFPNRPSPTSFTDPMASHEPQYLGTPTVRNTYNLHRSDEDEDEVFQRDTDQEKRTDHPWQAGHRPPIPTVSPAHPYSQPTTPHAQPVPAASAPITPQVQPTPVYESAPVRQEPSAVAASHIAPPPPAPPVPQAPPASSSASPYSTENWIRPSLSLLEDRPPNEDIPTEEDLKEMGDNLEVVLSQYKIKGQVVAIRRGPVATLFEFRPVAGTRESQIAALSDDIARSLAVANVRITRVPGRNTVGLEVPNYMRDMVSFVELLSNPTWTSSTGMLELALGKNVTGKPIYADLAKMPHLMVAGTTGSGKSVGMNAMLLSLLFRLSPDDCKMILVDPKKLEFSLYEGIPHLLTPVITEADKALGALRWAVGEMERRYQFLADAGVRNIVNYNHRAKEIREGRLSPIRTYHSGNDPQTGLPITEELELPSEHLPYIVIVIDEMADLMMSDGKGKEIEAGVVRLAQKARACGIHLIIATQRPSADVITGLIKANFPSRIAFQVTNKIDSRIVLDAPGGEQLLGNGDMLFRLTGKPIIRLHGPFISEEEVDAVANDLRNKRAPIYNADIAQKMEEAATEDNSKGSSSSDSNNGPGGDKDELYEDAIDIIFKHKRATASFLQRQLSIGYNRASKIIEMMEEDGIVGPASPSGKREIYGRKAPLPEKEEDGFANDDVFTESEENEHGAPF
ncbi:hypothetical protein FAI40_02705 [Acetobacteraceae bacterium]|nr:hypothetical protein FAI40_02705 [Acetobacteraceae bacterium]